MSIQLPNDVYKRQYYNWFKRFKIRNSCLSDGLYVKWSAHHIFPIQKIMELINSNWFIMKHVTLFSFPAGSSWYEPLWNKKDTVITTQQRRVRVSIVAVEKQWVLHNLSMCVCSLMYPACNAHAPYGQMRPALLCNIFPQYHINGKIFGKMKKKKKCVFWFSPQLLPEIFLILRRNERDMIKNVYWSSRTVPFIPVRF
jgi:hypothetical protein